MASVGLGTRQDTGCQSVCGPETASRTLTALQHRVLWRAAGVRFVLRGGMEFDRMDENDWKYHGEGNKSLVVSHVQVNKLS